MNVETRAFEKRGSQEGSRGRKDATLLQGKFSGGCRGSAGSTPRPRRKTPWSRRRRPLRPAIPTLRAAVAARAARGRPGPWVASVPRLPPGFRGLPHPEAELKTQRMRVNPFPGADARPPVSGAGVAFEPPYPSPEESLAPPPGVGPLRRRNAPRGWTVVPSGPGPPTSEERPPPRGRAPLQPAATSPRRPMPPSPGPRQRPPPAAAGSGAKRGLQPLGAPAPARGFPSPSASTRRPPALRPAEAGARRAVPLGGEQGRVPSGSPSPTHFRRRP
ncbi:proline-rich protein HaeIII subfamily 1-like [Myotis daubentonii]|uniref:proline-rich protein HaeIII subfamily 1-like n=1 Tax=Myotis daubentonii TaxID=98922 RepID=UPI00287343AF|nr:proline-rich protein HaeIII subfamily 1-like [Myotis daubentonii]